MNVTCINHNIIQINFKRKSDLARTFIRFQEYYESPEFRGKIFTLGQFREWYSKQNGGFTYYDDWSGFNIPSSVLDVFRCGLFDPLTKEEQNLINLIPARLNPFYLIGTSSDSENDVLDHEICHGLYTTSNPYKVKVDQLLSKYMNELNELKEYLVKLGYHNDVIMDECHAYISASSDYLDDNKISYPKLTEKLQALKDEYL